MEKKVVFQEPGEEVLENVETHSSFKQETPNWNQLVYAHNSG